LITIDNISTGEFYLKSYLFLSAFRKASATPVRDVIS
jgi:hypothetical protein